MATVSPARSPLRALWGLGICLPWMIAGATALHDTDPLLETLESPQFTEAGQQQLEERLRASEVEHLWAADYDLYGMLEVRLPEVQVTHVWGDVSRRFRDRNGALEDLLRAARGDHVIFLEPSARRIYDLSPGPADLERAATSAGVEVERVWRLETERAGAWAWLYAVR